MNHQAFLDQIQQHRLIAILRGLSVEDSVAVVQALYNAGIRVVEFTYDHALPDCIEKTSQQVRNVRNAFGDELLLGCGTVLTAEEAEAGYAAGARLIISPNTNESVIRRTRELGMVSMPGALTPTEVVAAHEAGADIVKLFPAGALGLSYIKALRAPLRHIPMSAVGGVTPETAAAFLDTGVCSLGVGSEMVRPADVQAHNLSVITERAQAFVKAVAEWKEKQE